MAKWFRAMWYGMRLICPACEQGRIYAGLLTRNHRCPACGAYFEPGEGDFLGSMFMAYTGTVIVVGTVILLLGLLTDMGLTELLLLGVASSTLFLLLFYRNMRGIWLGILFMLTGFQRDP